MTLVLLEVAHLNFVVIYHFIWMFIILPKLEVLSKGLCLQVSDRVDSDCCLYEMEIRVSKLGRYQDCSFQADRPK